MIVRAFQDICGIINVMWHVTSLEKRCYSTKMVTARLIWFSWLHLWCQTSKALEISECEPSSEFPVDLLSKFCHVIAICHAEEPALQHCIFSQRVLFKELCV